MKRWTYSDGYIAGMLRRAIADALAQAACQVGSDVLDIGSGTQPYKDLIESTGATYTPCDLGAGPHTTLEPGKALPLAPHRYTIGLSIQVLEHVWDLDWYLGLYRRHLRQEGYLILSTHGVWPYHPHPADYRRWTRMGLRRELESRGFSIDQVVPLMGPLAWTTQVRLSGFAHVTRGVNGWLRAPVALVNACGNTVMWIGDKVTPTTFTADNACIYLVICRPVAEAARSTSAS